MGKKGKGKKLSPEEKAREEALLAEAAEKKELQLKAKRLKAECEGEERLYNTFLQEREKVNYFWIVEKKTLAEKQADLRNQERQLQDQEERHQIELKMFQQRLKHLRYHEQDEVVELKQQNEYKLKLQEDRHRLAEGEVRKDKGAVKKEVRTQEVQVEEYIRSLKLQQDAKIQQLRLEFDAKARDLQAHAAQKMKSVRDEMEKQRQQEKTGLEDATNAHIARCMAQNAKDFHEIKLYYGDITSSNLELIKRLKEEHAELKKRESSDAKQMYDLQQKNKQLAEPLKKAQQDVERLQEEAQLYAQDKKRLANVKAKIKDQETQLNTRAFQSEVLLQQTERVERERDELYHKFSDCIYKVQQRTGLKNLLLEKKLSTLGEQLEITDAEVSELIASAQGAPGVASKMEDLVRHKNEQIASLHTELQRVRDAHHTMTNSYGSKLAAHGVPVEELGFVPA
ncbi:unnamed protein product [Amoebophrya sp. A120]|nr:unnamed protein product [Amoebophrya sp. A120]|eukprot:GSA120T00011045001.1